MNKLLRVPCSYQGGKQRIAPQIVDRLLDAAPHRDCHFYDLCCGSGAISIELVNRGISPSHIHMLDISTWGAFWSAIGSGNFDMKLFDRYLEELPDNKREYKAHMEMLSARPFLETDIELYPILQANSFGGKQIWHDGTSWENACFRDYWEPTATSIRRSPANPMQPGPTELRRRIDTLTKEMIGVKAIKDDIETIFDFNIPSDAVVYVDPPYKNTTKYGFDFNLDSFVKKFRNSYQVPLYISEGTALNDNAIMLTFGGAKGGISGFKKRKHEEWLNRF